MNRVEGDRIKASKEILKEAVDSSKSTDHVKHILNELEKGITKPNHFSIHEYVNIIIKYILDDISIYKQYEILALIDYIVLCFIPKDNNDFPSAKITDTQIQQLIVDTANLADNHPYKWDNKRKKLVKEQSSKYKKVVYTDDFLYLWKLYIVNTTPIQEITDQDIRAKYLLDTLLQRFCFEYSTERIILKHLSSVAFKRLKKCIQEIFRLIRTQETSTYFSSYNTTDFFLDTQVSNQYVLKTSEPKHKIEAKAKQESNRRALPVEVYTYLKKEDLIEECKLLE